MKIDKLNVDRIQHVCKNMYIFIISPEKTMLTFNMFKYNNLGYSEMTTTNNQGINVQTFYVLHQIREAAQLLFFGLPAVGEMVNETAAQPSPPQQMQETSWVS